MPRSKTVFLSVHADSLHSSVRGAMVYVPSRYLRPSEPYTVGRSDIKGFAEFKAHPTIRLGNDFKARVEASSRHMAGSIIGSLERNEIAVHENEPVRDRVLRGRRGVGAGGAALHARRAMRCCSRSATSATPKTVSSSSSTSGARSSLARSSKDSLRRMTTSGCCRLLVIRRSNYEFLIMNF